MSRVNCDFDGDGRAEILVTSPWGLGILKRSGSTLTSSTMAPNGTNPRIYWNTCSWVKANYLLKVDTDHNVSNDTEYYLYAESNISNWFSTKRWKL